jgi:hypothetical protein
MEMKAKGRIIRRVKKKEPLSEIAVAARPDADFYKHHTLGELAKEQGVKPIKDIRDLTGFWPEGADFDEFYKAAVLSRKHAEPD